MAIFGSYSILLYLALAFVLHAITHWAYEDSKSMSSADYIALVFFIYLGAFIMFIYYLPECGASQAHSTLCWYTGGRQGAQ